MEASAGFEGFCRAEYAPVVRLAFWMTGDRQEALDLAQEAFARAYERWRRVSKMDRPEAWVQRVTVNLALLARRRRRLLPRLRAQAEERVMPEPEVRDPDLARALLLLTPAQRAVIVLRYYADRSVEETAHDLGKQPGTVRALTSQGLARLRKALSMEGVEDEARG
jgi:RNA polymerase sigma-70 factor (sigma-E family)